MRGLLLKLLLPKKVRRVVWNALVYSDMKYRKQDNVDRACETSNVMQYMKCMLPKHYNVYTQDQVDKIVKCTIEETLAKTEERIDEAFACGVKVGTNSERVIGIAIPMFVGEDEATTDTKSKDVKQPTDGATEDTKE